VRSGITHLHYAKGEVIFRKGDVGDYLYTIVDGRVEILKEKDGKKEQVATLGKGEFFGEMALLRQKKRTATVRCLEDTELIAIRKHDFNILVTNFGDLHSEFQRIESKRHEMNKDEQEVKKNIEHIGDLHHPPEESDFPPQSKHG